MPKLLLHVGSPSQREFQLHPGVNTLGSTVTNDISIYHHSIEDLHCEIVVEDEGVLVRDLGSRYGCFVNEVQLHEGYLQASCTLRVGEVELLFQEDAPELVPTAELFAVEEQTAATPRVYNRMRDGSPACENHGRYQARFECPQCSGFFCDLCVTTTRVKGILHKQCRKCQCECGPVDPTLLNPTDEDADKSFFALLPKVFRYPFQGDGWVLMITGTLFYLFVNFIANAGVYSPASLVALILVSVFAFGYLFSYQQRIVVTTTNGAQEMPDWPDFLGWGDVFGPLMQLIIILAFCFSPTLLMAILASNQPFLSGLVAPTMVLGCLYFPMAILAVSMFDTVMALNPVLIIPSMLRVYREYLTACGVLLLILLLQGLVNFCMDQFKHAIVIPSVVCGFFAWYFLTVEMRLLGVLYRTKKAELGWFRK
ncbi:FHA domain-containing protein [Pedosphaera parvula]|uniref:FHA domain containing protein n=1 Tax=Pedosphaera parvula (strain Ellin514) TaxID=320771 RepID=B9XNH5_PEDPL|nr:FHA domain-containing protein [Pedosphaera parvula]EEF58634.1 FHA domain containing protein [Pedosphaera parvula Ellin514]